jgi:hypothetical protein
MLASPSVLVSSMFSIMSAACRLTATALAQASWSEQTPLSATVPGSRLPQVVQRRTLQLGVAVHGQRHNVPPLISVPGQRACAPLAQKPHAKRPVVLAVLAVLAVAVTGSSWVLTMELSYSVLLAGGVVGWWCCWLVVLRPRPRPRPGWLYFCAATRRAQA